MKSSCRKNRRGFLISAGTAHLILIVFVSVGPVIATPGLVVGQLTLVPASSDAPYAYGCYAPGSTLGQDIVGLVWHATPGGTQANDAVFWARFDLLPFLACGREWGAPRANLPEMHRLILFSVAVPEPASAFYKEHAGIQLGTPVSLSFLGTLDVVRAGEDFRDPDLMAMQSITDLKQRLSGAGISYDDRVFVTGVYKGAEWAHRFALLHPQTVRAVTPVCGNIYTVPIESLDGIDLPCPLGLSQFDSLGRAAFDAETLMGIPYFVTVSFHENLWYNQTTPEEKGCDQFNLDRYVATFGSIPPERAVSFAESWRNTGYDIQLLYSEGGHGWIDSLRQRVFKFFASFSLAAE